MNKEKKTMTETEEGMTLVTALDRVQEAAEDSELSEEFWEEVASEIRFLTGRLELTPIQVVVVAILCEMGEAMSWRNFGKYLGLSRLKAMSYDKEITGLVKKRWLCRSGARERGLHSGGSVYQGFKLIYGVVTAMREDRIFVPEPLEGFDTQGFVERLGLYLMKEGQSDMMSNDDHLEWIIRFAELNDGLPMARALLDCDPQDEAMVLALAVDSYARFADTCDEPIWLSEISKWFDEPWRFNTMQRGLQRGLTELQRQGWLEFANDNGLADTSGFILTAKAKEELLEGFAPERRRPRKGSMRELVSHTKIKPRPLFFNDETERQAERMRRLLEEEALVKVRERLEAGGMRRGVTALFYGAPGTGKTEFAHQLARLTGRDIMQVSIAGMRDKFVGESEKNIQGVFSRYRELVKQSDRVPILLFNEADAIIGTRFENTRSSVEKMDNSMQNILLQEMEDFEGIMIATTNLQGNLDKAFDRRFLFKMEFTKPDRETRFRIWRSMLGDAGEEQVRELSGRYDFSGGQIENVARKYSIESILEAGAEEDPGLLGRLCAEEVLRRDSRARIGFAG